MKKAALFVIIIGFLLTIFTAFKFFTREKVVDLGSVSITANKAHKLQWSPLLGVGVMVLGGIMFLIPVKK
jgi:hypothetical protein